MLRALDIGLQTSLDIEVEDTYQFRRWMRITSPSPDGVVLDPNNPSVYLFTAGTAIFIDRKDGNRVPDSPEGDIYMELNSDGHVEGMPAGRLKMWQSQSNTRQ